MDLSISLIWISISFIDMDIHIFLDMDLRKVWRESPGWKYERVDDNNAQNQIG